MPRVLILADDLTGAADCAAAFLGRAPEVGVLLDARVPRSGAIAVVDLDTRTRAERTARAIARRAFGSRAARSAGILYKKIDSTLKGHVSAELAALRRGLGSRPVVFAPAFPAQGRVTRDARLILRGVTASGDLRALLSRSGLPTTHFDLPAVRADLPRAFRHAMAIGAQGMVCDAASDADLDRIARAGLAMRPRPLFVGSAGLARALARTLPARKPRRRPAIERRPIVTVIGSAARISARQAVALSRAKVRGPVFRIEWRRPPSRKDVRRVRNLGRMAAAIPSAHYVLTGGETARAVLGARGIREFRLLGEVEPGVPFGLARDGTLICTKAGAFGRADTLVKCVARLAREMKKS